MQLLTRLYELSKDGGQITIGGVDIGAIPLEWLRGKIGMVLQEPFLYSRTIKENIAVAASNASMEEIVQAAQIACIHDAIQNFADGYDTLVGGAGGDTVRRSETEGGYCPDAFAEGSHYDLR